MSAPRVGDPPHLDVEQTLTEMYEVLEVLKGRVESGEHAINPQQLEDETRKLERQVQPIQRVWQVLGVIAAILIVGAAGGVAYNQFMTDNVTREDLEQYDKSAIDPLEDDVVRIKLDVGEVTSAVDTILLRDKRRQEIEYKKALLDEYRSDYQECLSEYAATKSSGKYAQRCKKDPKHVELEVQLKTALGQ